MKNRISSIKDEILTPEREPAKNLIEDNQIKNDKTVKHVNESLIEMNPENETLNKAINFVVKILNFNKQQKGK